VYPSMISPRAGGIRLQGTRDRRKLLQGLACRFCSMKGASAETAAATP
jgi:hypothetical protein